MATTKASASAVSRALRAGGMTKSETSTTRIKGWHNYSTGFRASSWSGIDHVEVEWVNGGFRREDRSAEEMAKAEAILIAKGYAVETVTGDFKTTLKVRKAARDEEN